MKTYVLGAGASLHAGYPLAGNMGTKLIEWMRHQGNDDFTAAADWVRDNLGQVANAEDLFSELEMMANDFNIARSRADQFEER